MVKASVGGVDASTAATTVPLVAVGVEPLVVYTTLEPGVPPEIVSCTGPL